MTSRDESGLMMQTTRTLARGLAILEALVDAERALTLSDVGRRIGLDKATAKRLLFTLCETGYVTMDSDTLTYQPSPKLLTLGSTYAETDLRGVTHPFLEELRDDVDETVHLGVLSRGHIVYIDKLESSRSIRLVTHIGQTKPVHSTALGKAILACMASDEAARIIDQLVLEPLTSHTHTSRKALLADLRRCRERGYAVDDEETTDNVVCVGAAIAGGDGWAPSAVSVSGPAFRLKAHVQDVGNKCRLTTARITDALSGGHVKAMTVLSREDR